jgi:ABC-type bacteriocin/lantibiotic exporter with double-glycine peptidase domain
VHLLYDSRCGKCNAANFQIASFAVGIRGFCFNAMSERIARAIRKDYYDKIITKDVAFYDERRTGDLCKFITSLT